MQQCWPAAGTKFFSPPHSYLALQQPPLLQAGHPLGLCWGNHPLTSQGSLLCHLILSGLCLSQVTHGFFAIDAVLFFFQ